MSALPASSRYLHSVGNFRTTLSGTSLDSLEHLLSELNVLLRLDFKGRREHNLKKKVSRLCFALFSTSKTTLELDNLADELPHDLLLLVLAQLLRLLLLCDGRWPNELFKLCDKLLARSARLRDRASEMRGKLEYLSRSIIVHLGPGVTYLSVERKLDDDGDRVCHFGEVISFVSSALLAVQLSVCTVLALDVCYRLTGQRTH